MTIGIGIIGFGFMGKTHLEAYQAAIRNGIDAQLVSVYSFDVDSTKSGNVETGAADSVDLDSLGIHRAESLEELLTDDRVTAVSICTPTDTHVELASSAMRAGKHVLVEKPVALTPESIAELSTVAEETGCLCMPAMCMRFWPGWSWLHDQIRTGQFGPVISARFQRIGAAPGWSQDFYGDERRSGGALTDLHIHDVDFIISTFGLPSQVSCSGSHDQMMSTFDYPDGPHSVTAEGAWYPVANYPFQMRYRVCFSKVIADYDMAREGEELKLYSGDQEEVIPLKETSGYQLEIEHFLSVVENGVQPRTPNLREAEEVARWIQAEAVSLSSGDKASP